MKKLPLTLFIFLFTLACKKSSDDQHVNEPLTISSISPDHGPVNTTVTINGTGFDSNVAGNSVFFNGKAATILSASSNILVAKVPAGAGSGSISIKVNNNNTVSSQSFTYETTITSTVIAGSGFAGVTNGAGTNASFALPIGIAVDTSGIIYVANLAASTIKRINQQAFVTPLAGQSFVPGNQDGIGSGALFNYVYDIATDKAGNVFAADYLNNNVRKITPTGTVTTIAGGLNGPTGITVDEQNNIYIVSPSNDNIRKISPAGIITNIGTGSNSDEIYDVAADQQGNLFVCDRGTNMIRKISPSGTVTDVAGVWHISGNNNGAGNTATFKKPSSIAVDKNGNIYVADVGNNAIRKINSSGIVSTYLANAASYTTDAGFFGSYGVAVDKNGIVYITNTEHRIVKIAEQ